MNTGCAALVAGCLYSAWLFKQKDELMRTLWRLEKRHVCGVASLWIACAQLLCSDSIVSIGHRFQHVHGVALALSS